MKAFWKQSLTAAAAIITALAAAGCINLPDIPDIDWPDVPAVVTNLPPIVNPPVKPDPQGNVPIGAFTGRYIEGDEADKGGSDIHKRWGRTNLRLYNYGASVRKAGIPAKGPWYYFDASVIPEGSFTYREENGDAILVGKDFTSKRTKIRYRFEGFHIGKEAEPLRRYSTFRVPIKTLGSEATIWNWVAVEAAP
jgi:hypothetical protein